VPELEHRLGCTFVSLIDVTVNEILNENHAIVGILASPMTIHTKLYEIELEGKGIAVLVPTEKEMEIIEESIRNVISGKTSSVLRTQIVHIADTLTKRGAEAIILGCTELSVMFAGEHDSRFIDPLTAITRKLLP